jgi:hypothetical protein
MKLSIFPQTPDAKFNWTNTQVVDVGSVNDLAETITAHHYSGGIFKENYCNIINFLSTEFIILDYDNKPHEMQMPLKTACEVFAPYKHIIATTKSHQIEKSGAPAADRFRVVLFLAATITDADTFSATWHAVANSFQGCDQAAKDPARRFFAGLNVISVNPDGALIPVVEPAQKQPVKPFVQLPPGVKGKLARDVKDFMLEGIEHGWNDMLYKAAKDHQQNNYTKEEFIERATRITGHLDKSDMATINSAFRKPAKHGPRLDPDTFSEVEAWVRNWLEEHKATRCYNTEVLTIDGEERPADLLLSDIMCAADFFAEQNPIVDDKGKEHKRARYQEPMVQHVLGRWYAEQEKKYLEGVRERLQHEHPENRSIINRWVQAATGKQDPKDIAVMTHFIWQVKRKLHGLPVDNHMMPILYGETGGGKTRAIGQLLKPIQDLVNSPQDMTVLGDTREGVLLGKYFVLFFDELARADKLDVAALKNKITCEKISYRKLGTNSIVVKTNTATFIGASNNEVQGIIYDPTSARRFWQVNTIKPMDWTTINSLDYLALWRSISEEEACPLLPLLDEISHIQNNELRSKSLVEQWLESDVEAVGDGGMKATTAFEVFKEWCAWQGVMSQMTFHTFGSEVKRLGIPKVRRTAGMEYLIRSKRKL